MATDNMRDFFKVANLGPSDPADPNSGPFNKFLLVAHNGITTRNIMTILFNIYTLVNNMQNPENRSILTSTPLMDQYFHQTYDHLAAQPRQFNPNSFRFSRLQSIINDNKKDNLTKEQVSLLNERRMVEHLEKEYVFLSKILKTYRDMIHDKIITSQI